VRQVIGEILPFAVVVMVSPINIIAAILLLFSPRPVPAAAAYLGGFALGVGAVLVAFDLVGEQIDWSSSDASRGGAVVRIALGVLLFVTAVKKVRAHATAEGPPELPPRMQGISSMAPRRAAVTGLAIGALNPKNIAMALAAALSIGAASLSTADAAVVVVVYVVLASAGVAAPLVTTLLLGERSGPVLERWRAWLERNNDVVMAVLYFVFAFVLVGNGVAKW
jgi:threonine/homoserine/homoserine lactone efflux protein